MAAQDYGTPDQGAPDQSTGDGAHTHPSYDSKLAELEQRITALEGGGGPSKFESSMMTPKGMFGGENG